jgi:hypothetical protein
MGDSRGWPFPVPRVAYRLNLADPGPPVAGALLQFLAQQVADAAVG